MNTQVSPPSSAKKAAVPSSPQTKPRRLFALILIGILALGSGLLYRRHHLSAQRFLPTTSEELNKQRLIEQLTSLRLAVHQAPSDAEARWKLVEFYENIGMVDQAGPQLEVLVRQNPNSEKAHVELAGLLLAAGRLPEAERAYQSAVRRWPRSASAWQGRASVLYHTGSYLEAYEAARRSLKLQPADPDTKLVLASAAMEYALQYPNPQQHQAELDVARGYLLDLTHTWPDQGEVYYKLGRACRASRDTGNAITYLNRALQLMPDNANARVELARAQLQTGDNAAIRRAVTEALQHGVKDASLYDIEGQMLQQSPEPDSEQRAMEAYQNALQLAPNNIRYMEALGTAYLRLNRMPDARSLFERVVRRNPNRSYSYQQLALIYSRMEMRTQASAASQMATRMAFNDNQLKQVQSLSRVHPEDVNLHLILADRYRDLQNTGAAHDEYLFALRLQPGSKKAQKGLAALSASTPGVQAKLLDKLPTPTRQAIQSK